MMKCTESSHKPQKILNEEVPDICAAAEPGMKSEEIEEFKQKLEIEYNKAFKALII